MRELGLWALAHANWHAHYFSHENPCWSELSVLQAAHAAEILIKARIAQEHPLLIFEQLPKPGLSPESGLTFDHLIENGKTYQWNELPDRLWATTQIRLPDVERFRAFGRLRNTIQHFAAPERDVSDETIRFIFGVIDPFINACWAECAVDYNEDHEPYVYFVAGLITRGVIFNVSSGCVEHEKFIEFEWPEGQSEYRSEMERRFSQAKSQISS